ncbi:MAG: 2Fe-2S iron-sulfur cluster binding domain-containing protein [Planctomycetales bacterium]|nr:2Fe-2S iron-sulfur cluster binding domain-containing protein [Planctomycetales bacterium]
MELSTFFAYGGMAMVSLVTAQLGAGVLRTAADAFTAYQCRRRDLELLDARILVAKREMAVRQSSDKAWEGLRKFRVRWKVAECQGIHSLYLVPHDGRPLPPFRPGQYLTLSVRLPGDDRPTIRCYSLSDSPKSDYYRLSVKKATPPPDAPDAPSGKVSSYVNDVVCESDILDVKAPSGSFYLHTDKETPVVLLAGGVGITPVLSMLNYLVDVQSHRQVYFFLGVRNGLDHPFHQHLSEIARTHDNIKIVTCYSRPRSNDQQGCDYDVQGRVTVDLIKQYLGVSNYDFYLCGPPAFLDSLVTGLKAWGVPKTSIHQEAFGPSRTSKPVAVPDACEKSEVQFAKSNRTATWDGSLANLLDLADAAQIPIDSGCRAGNCGTCLTAIKSGSVKYSQDPGCDVDDGCCLPCIASPDGPLVLDA